MESCQQPETTLTQTQEQGPLTNQQQQLSKIPGIQSIRIYKFLFEHFTSQHKELIQSIKENRYQNRHLFDLQSIELKKYFENVIDLQIGRQAGVYETVLGQLIQLLNQFVLLTQESLSQHDEEQMLDILAMINDIKKKQSLPQQELTIKTLIKIDILMLFFKENDKYKLLITKYSAEPILASRHLSRIFNLDHKFIIQAQKKFKKIKQWIKNNNEYYDKIKDLITLFFLTEIRNKITGHYKRFGKEKVLKFEKQSAQHLKIKLSNNNKQQSINKEANFQFRFCEVAFFHLGTCQIEAKKRSQLKESVGIALKDINQKYKQNQYMREMLKISVIYNITMESLLELNQKIISMSSNQNIELKKQVEKRIEALQWAFLKCQSEKLLQTIRNITEINFNIYEMFTNNTESNEICKGLYTLSMERLKLASKVFKTQDKVQKLYSNPLQIFISKQEFYYNYENGKQLISFQAQNHTKQSKAVTLIMATADNRLIFYCIQNKKMRDDFYYGEMIKMIMKRLNKLPSFNLYLYEMDYNRHITSYPAYHFNRYLKRDFNSKVYIIGPFNKLAAHNITYEIIKASLCHLQNVNEETFIKTAHNLIHTTLSKISLLLNPTQHPTNVNSYAKRKQMSNLFCTLLEQIGQFEDLDDIQTQFHNYEAKMKNIYELFSQSILKDKGQIVGYKGEIKVKGNIIPYIYTIVDQMFYDEKDENIHENRVVIARNCNKMENQLSFDIKRCLQESLRHFMYRHPEILAQQQKFTLQVSVDRILKARDLTLLNFKQILRDTARNLFIYQIFFIQDVSPYQQGKHLQKLQPQMLQSIQYLRKIYRRQNQKIQGIFGYQKDKILEAIICLDYYPQAKKIILSQKYEQAIVKQEERSQEDEKSCSFQKENCLYDKNEQYLPKIQENL